MSLSLPMNFQFVFHYFKNINLINQFFEHFLFKILQLLLLHFLLFVT